MGARVVRFNDTHPDTDEGNTQSAAEVKRLVEEVKVVAADQRAGLLDRAAGSAEKARLRRAIMAGPVAHLVEVSRRSKQTELITAFQYKPGRKTYVAFRTAARAMQAAAEEHKDVLIKHGRSDAVMEHFATLLDQFDLALQRTDDGRTRHVGATARLEGLAEEIQSVVRTMDARNRQRFEGNQQLLEEWLSASTVLGNKRAEVRPADGEPANQAGPAGPVPGGAPVAGGEARPAA